MEKHARRREQAGHHGENAAHLFVTRDRFSNVAEVPVDDACCKRPAARNARMGEVRSGGELPRGVHDLRDAPVEAAWQIRLSVVQALFEGLGFERSDRHALAVDGVEAAQGVACDEKAFGELAKTLVVPSEVGREVVLPGLAKWLGVLDDLMDVGGWQISCELDEARLVCWGAFSEPAAERNDPPPVLHAEHRADRLLAAWGWLYHHELHA